MNPYKNAPRLLGAAFLIVVATSAIAGIPLMMAVGSPGGSAIPSDSTAEMLVRISNNLTLMHISILGGMLNSTGIVFLAVLLYIVLSKQNKIMALAALGFWLGEALFYALTEIGALALIPLSTDFVAAGAPAHSFYLTLGEFLYYGVCAHGMTILMWFYCVGGLLWYYMFYKSNCVPRAISLLGIAAVSLALAGNVFELMGYYVPLYVALPIGLFEVSIGVWLVLKGIKDQLPAISQTS